MIAVPKNPTNQLTIQNVYDIKQLIKMQIMNSKAYYLKNYNPKKRLKTSPRGHLPQLIKQSNSSDNEIDRIRNINRSRRISNNSRSVHHDSANSTNSMVYPSHDPNSYSRDYASIFKKQKVILQKVIDNKLSQSRNKRSHTISTGSDYVLLERHPMGQINTLEVESMKPTQRYFHMMNNVRLAEKLLLSKPTPACSMKYCKEFYHQQREYKANITKMSFRGKRENQVSRLRLLNRRKWID